MPNQVHSLWIGNSLSAMELLTIQSFIENDFVFNLWVYEKINNLPQGIILKDANEIISVHQIFKYKNQNKFGHGKGSVSGFSDLFRYKLLYDKGGIWTDMDITCLQSFEIKEPYFFRYHHQIGMVGNFMKVPAKSDLMWYCYQETLHQVNEDNINWLLPIEILIQGIKKYDLQNFVGNISNMDSFLVVRKLLSNKKTPITQWKIIHWMNEEFRRLNIDKNTAIKNSTYQILLDKYHIKYQVLDKISALKLYFRISSFHYAWLNLKARINYFSNNFFLRN
ncbi:MAG TPA: glycosyltransferase [Chitinophagales bacterium]|nr:hypothetical protein [Chitinophagales bacterium]MCB0511060.1 hypothetical protein [Bacteroidota bacterium]MCB9075304.1 hypothetical protein [Chitinophagales bacterium]HMU97248.1 glycosyltransferase [Chitinophagales bacterium]HMV02051.1 glycosyltransferase [Chitinophagales bacterium]